MKKTLTALAVLSSIVLGANALGQEKMNEQWCSAARTVVLSTHIAITKFDSILQGVSARAKVSGELSLNDDDVKLVNDLGFYVNTIVSMSEKSEHGKRLVVGSLKGMIANPSLVTMLISNSAMYELGYTNTALYIAAGC